VDRILARSRRYHERKQARVLNLQLTPLLGDWWKQGPWRQEIARVRRGKLLRSQPRNPAIVEQTQEQARDDEQLDRAHCLKKAK
jgi:hypothetical protein